MKNIIPVNGHLLIDPIPRPSFMASSKEIFEEVGTVLEVSDDVSTKVSIGDKVYFDSWLAAKFPKGLKEFFWLVKWEDVRAIEHAEQQVSE